ncbi:TPM domain-containing protein [Patescibacteria group bacterium]|nr:MAG: TPM domain-containing protein [Patescibacteria group bacterium]
MRKLLPLLLVLVQLGAVPSFAVTYPDPQTDASGWRMVNDFAGVFSGEARDRLEQKLDDHEAKTSNEVVVAVVLKLQGEEISAYAEELFHKWGIGKAGRDNGILILIATDVPGKSGGKGLRWVEVGYGLEGVLPDSKVGEILRRNRVPFDQGKIAESVEGVVDDVLATIVPAQAVEVAPKPVVQLSPEEREAEAKRLQAEIAEHQLQRQREKEQAETIWFLIKSVLVGVVLYLILHGFVWFLRKKWRERKEREEKRRELNVLITEFKESLDHLRGYQVNFAQYKDYPSWVRAGAEKTAADLEKAVKEAEAEFLTVFDSDWRNAKTLDANLKQMARVRSAIQWAQRIQQNIESWPREIERLKKLAADKVAAARQAFAEWIQVTNALRSEGYRSEALREAEVAELPATFKKFDGLLQANEDPRPVIEEAIKLAESSASVVAQLKALPDFRKETDAVIQRHRTTLQSVIEDQLTVRRILEQIEQETPRSVWGMLDQTFKLMTGELLEQIETELVGAEQANAMEAQKFEAARKEVEEVGRQLGEVRQFFARIDEVRRKIADAKTNFPGVLARVQSVLGNAEAIASAPDVSSSHAIDLSAAAGMIVEAKRLSQGELVDWITAVELLTNAETLLNKVIKMAEREIKAAKERREAEARQAEADRLRLLREAAERAAEATRRSSSSHNNSPGGFKYGGGRSGGGGAGD